MWHRTNSFHKSRVCNHIELITLTGKKKCDKTISPLTILVILLLLLFFCIYLNLSISCFFFSSVWFVLVMRICGYRKTTNCYSSIEEIQKDWRSSVINNLVWASLPDDEWNFQADSLWSGNLNSTWEQQSPNMLVLTGLGGTGGMNFLYRDLDLSTSTTGSLISTGSCFTGMGISFSVR